MSLNAKRDDSVTRVTRMMIEASGKKPAQADNPLTIDSLFEEDFDDKFEAVVLPQDEYFALLRLYQFHQAELEWYEDAKLPFVDRNATHLDRVSMCDQNDEYFILFQLYNKFCNKNIEQFAEFKPHLISSLKKLGHEVDEDSLEEKYSALLAKFAELKQQEPEFSDFKLAFIADTGIDVSALIKKSSTPYSTLKVTKSNQNYMRKQTERHILAIENEITDSGVREFLAIFPKIMAVNEPVHGKLPDEIPKLNATIVTQLYRDLNESQDDQDSFRVTYS